MPVAKVIELVADSDKSFEDAIHQGLAAAAKSVHGITGLDVKNMTARVENNRITQYKVTMHVAFKVDKT
jgi:flavin-binding protein dodecin